MEIREEAEQETEPLKKDLLIKFVDWLDIKLKEWHKKLKEYENAFDKLEQSEGHDDEGEIGELKSRLIENYFNHHKEVGRLFNLYTALRIIRSEGKYWDGDAPSVKAVLEHVLNLIE
jgi:hypothetical protein